MSSKSPQDDWLDMFCVYCYISGSTRHLHAYSPRFRRAGDFKSAESYADMAIRHNRYNAKALVNKGNCLFMSKEYERAKEIFLEAIGVEV